MDEVRTTEYIILSQMKGIGPVTQNALLDRFHNITGCFTAKEEDLLTEDTVLRAGRNRIRSFLSQRGDKDLWNRAKKILELSQSLGIDVIVREDPRFPERFRGIPEMPVMLYVKGGMKINEYAHSVGVVGARRCSAQGKEEAIAIVTEAVKQDKAVVSGMAKGIDSYAHTAALKSRGYTLAVLGSGADICYPMEHRTLYEEIAARGCIVSEYPPGTPAGNFRFPQRNRMIAALSDVLYVIDAGRNSGTESTVEKGERYGRTVVRR